MNQTADQEFLEYLVKSLVDHPDDVKVDRKVDEMGVLLSLKVNAMDMGQVVGRQGATAKAIRSLLRIVGIKNNARVNLKIEEPDGAAEFRRSTFPVVVVSTVLDIHAAFEFAALTACPSEIDKLSPYSKSLNFNTEVSK